MSGYQSAAAKDAIMAAATAGLPADATKDDAYQWLRLAFIASFLDMRCKRMENTAARYRGVTRL